jgi:hypothetical protein
VRAYLFKVYRRSGGGPAYIEGSPTTFNVTRVQNFSYGMEKAWKLEAGWNATNGWGFRASAFRTFQSANTSRVAPAGFNPFIVSPIPLNAGFTGPADPGTTATFQEKFRIYSFDLEATRKWHSANHTLLVSAGLRIADTSQVYRANDVSSFFFLFPTASEVVIYSQNRRAYGPTAAFDWRDRLGGSNFWWTGTARLAWISGKNQENASYNGTGNFRNRGRGNGVFEFETGVEWAHKLGGGHEFFFGSSFIAHQWRNIVNIMPTNPVGGAAIASLDDPASNPTKKGSVAFIGGHITAGFRF